MSQLTPAQLEQIRLRAQAEIERLKAAGEWVGEIQPHTAYQKKPIEWIVRFLEVPEETLRWSMSPEYGRHEWDGDKDPIAKVLEALAEGKDCGVESATGVGKTFIGACIVLWFLACFENAIVPTVAPREAQLHLHIWKEIGRMWPKFNKLFPQAELLSGKLRMKPAKGEEEVWAATAFVCGVGANEESATRAQGFHAEHMLIITEETPGIHHAIMNSFQNTRTDDHNLQVSFGNPDHRLDQLHQFCIDPWVEHIRISALDHPNIVTHRPIVPGAIGPKRLAQRTERYKKGSRFYQSRVRGISPAEAEDALISWEWCEVAAKKYAEAQYREGVLALGVDVAASEDGDKGAISRWQGACCTEVKDFPCPDPNELGRDVAREIEGHGESTDKIDPRHVGVDVVGVGAGTVNELKRLGHKVRRISSATRAIPGLDVDELWSVTDLDEEGRSKPKGAKVIEAELFDNLRSQVWWRMREDLRLGRIALPPDESLFEDLTTPTYKTDGGIIRVQKKEEIVKELKRSPNKGDACVYGNWVRRRRPIQPAPVVPFAPRPDVDLGLEKYLSRHAKEVAARERIAKRQLKKLGLA